MENGLPKIRITEQLTKSKKARWCQRVVQGWYLSIYVDCHNTRFCVIIWTLSPPSLPSAVLARIFSPWFLTMKLNNVGLFPSKSIKRA